MAERRPTLTAAERGAVRNLRSGRKKACGAVEQKKAQKLRKKASTEIGLDSAPAHINPHRACGSVAAHIPRVPSLEAFGRRGASPIVAIGPSSETVHTSRI